MKRLAVMLALIVAVGLVAASSALADVRAPGNATWTGIAPADVRSPSDVRQGARAWDVRKPSQAKGWTDVRQTDVRARFAPNPWKNTRADWSS